MAYLDLDGAQDPVLTVRLKGADREYDPFDLLDKLRSVRAAPGTETFASDVDAIREAFGFPKAGAGETLTMAQCLKLLYAVIKTVEESDEVGKLLGPTQGSCEVSPASAPSKPGDSPAPIVPA